MKGEINQSKMNWDMTSFFPEFGGSVMEEFKQSLRRDIDSTKEKAQSLSVLSEGNQNDWEDVFLKYEDLLKRFSHLSAYIECLASADANCEEYLREEAALSVISAELSKLRVELQRAFKGATDEAFSSYSRREAFSGCEYALCRLREESEHMMDREKEVLSADLSVDGIHAWGRLYDTISAKLEFEMTFPDGNVERVPISKRRSLLEHPDREIRRAAFEGGNRAWQSVEDVTCAAINAISGTRLTLNRHRGIKHFLDIALFQSAITGKTLEAMREAIYSEIELPRAILKTKAQAMGEEKIRWYDMGAPTALDTETYFSWDEARELVARAIGGLYPKFADFFCSLHEKKWVDWEPRAGKRPGGFCTASMLSGESRVFMTYNGGLGDIFTLAHEAGHAFHNHLIQGMRPFSQTYPMTLAECASTFGELLLQRGLIDDPHFAGEKKAIVLDMETSHGAIYLLDITVRFEFEKALYEERASGELSVSRLKDIMTETQRALFGDVLEEGWEDPYYWSSKLHFYITGITFYNFPYTFGYLLSRGLYGMLKKEGEAFFPKYEEFLRLSGSGTATDIARKCLGLDLENPEFWTEAIATLKEPLDQLRAIMISKAGNKPQTSFS